MLEEYGKQLVKSSSEKESLTPLKQKETFEELANERLGEIQNLSKKLILIIQLIVLREKLIQFLYFFIYLFIFYFFWF